MVGQISSRTSRARNEAIRGESTIRRPRRAWKSPSTPHRTKRAERRAARPGRPRRNVRGQPLASSFPSPKIHQPRPAVPGPVQEGKSPDEGGRQVTSIAAVTSSRVPATCRSGRRSRFDCGPGGTIASPCTYRDDQQERRTSRQMQHRSPRADTGGASRELAMPLEKVRKVLEIAKERSASRRRSATRRTPPGLTSLRDRNAVLPIAAAIQSNLRETTTGCCLADPARGGVLRQRSASACTPTIRWKKLASSSRSPVSASARIEPRPAPLKHPTAAAAAELPRY